MLETDTLINEQSSDILILSGDDEMLARYHSENAIYLYCITNRTTAEHIINKSYNTKLPLKLYENQFIAKKAVENTNILDAVCIRIAVNLNCNPYYDQFVMTSKMIFNKTKKSVEQYRKQCLYERTYNKNYGIIEYTINNLNIVINAQII